MEKFKEYNIKLEKSDEKGMINGNAMLYYLGKAKKAICEINLSENGFGSGFLCKIPYTENNNLFIPVLITCNHVLSKDLIKKNDFKIIIDGETKILSLNKRKIWTDENLDFTCIEIKEKDDKINTFFNLDDDVFNINSFNECFLKQKVFIFAINNFENGRQLAFSNGIIISNINEGKFAYTCNSYPGCSGGCIVNQYNNNIIGIHKGELDKENKKGEKMQDEKIINVGIFIGDVIKCIKESKNSLLSIVNQYK